MTMLFAAFVLALPLAAAWDDGACAAHAPPRELTTSTQSHSVWPPGTRCGYVGADGTAVERFVDAGRWEPLRWPVLVLLAAAPVTLAAGLAASIRELHARASASPRRRVGGITT